MLVPIQTSGTKPPLFFVHGLRGITFAVGPNFARALGPDQPVYVINANGMDGRQPVIDDAREMVAAYYDDIQRARPAGPLRIGAMCSGCLIAIELARRLQKDGRQTGPLILADPPPVPFGYDKRRNTVDFARPQMAERMYQEVRANMLEKASYGYDALPFDPADPQQLHAATLAGIGSMVAFAKYVPTPFSGPTEMIMSAPGRVRTSLRSNASAMLAFSAGRERGSICTKTAPRRATASSATACRQSSLRQIPT